MRYIQEVIIHYALRKSGAKGLDGGYEAQAACHGSVTM